MTDSESYSYWRLPGESPALYKWLGVKIFKELCPSTNRFVRRAFNVNNMPKRETPEASTRELIRFTKVLETFHLGMAVCMQGFIEGASGGAHDSRMLLGSLAVQIPANVYPVMLQRYNRLNAYQRLDDIQATADAAEDIRMAAPEISSMVEGQPASADTA